MNKLEKATILLEEWANENEYNSATLITTQHDKNKGIEADGLVVGKESNVIMGVAEMEKDKGKVGEILRKAEQVYKNENT